MRGILRGNHEKRFRQGPGFSLGGDLPFLHGFEQRALGLRRGAIDLVGQHHLGEDGTRMKMEGAAAAIEDRHAEDVRRQHVAGELDALEIESEDARQHMGQGGLADTGQVFDQQVPASQEAGQGKPDRPFLAEDDLVDVGQDGIEFREAHWGGEFRRSLGDNVVSSNIVSHQARDPS